MGPVHTGLDGGCTHTTFGWRGFTGVWMGRSTRVWIACIHTAFMATFTCLNGSCYSLSDDVMAPAFTPRLASPASSNPIDIQDQVLEAPLANLCCLIIRITFLLALRASVHPTKIPLPIFSKCPDCEVREIAWWPGI